MSPARPEKARPAIASKSRLTSRPNRGLFGDLAPLFEAKHMSAYGLCRDFVKKVPEKSKCAVHPIRRFAHIEYCGGAKSIQNQEAEDNANANMCNKNIDTACTPMPSFGTRGGALVFVALSLLCGSEGTEAVRSIEPTSVPLDCGRIRMMKRHA
mmetsp:Transcript_54746/g.163700  ORF Transcript_54746/g.163700 Transcript_54746/m.163700 type:complete len:154 (+) Transcript_54746:2275-2736(+)